MDSGFAGCWPPSTFFLPYLLPNMAVDKSPAEQSEAEF